MPSAAHAHDYCSACVCVCALVCVHLFMSVNECIRTRASMQFLVVCIAIFLSLCACEQYVLFFSVVGQCVSSVCVCSVSWKLCFSLFLNPSTLIIRINTSTHQHNTGHHTHTHQGMPQTLTNITQRHKWLAVSQMHVSPCTHAQTIRSSTSY